VAAVPVSIGRSGDRPGRADSPYRFGLDWGRGYTVSLFNFGLACCAVEFAAATMSHPEVIEPGPPSPDARSAELMVVSGTVTDKIAPAILAAYNGLPEPKYVVSFGSCANCGGPYWDSYCVTKGVDQILPVDVYVPGCPPRPEALLDGIRRLEGSIVGDQE
jgi:NADH-quinone oxidoreductase subunit B